MFKKIVVIIALAVLTVLATSSVFAENLTASGQGLKIFSVAGPHGDNSASGAAEEINRQIDVWIANHKDIRIIQTQMFTSTIGLNNPQLFITITIYYQKGK